MSARKLVLLSAVIGLALIVWWRWRSAPEPEPQESEAAPARGPAEEPNTPAIALQETQPASEPAQLSVPEQSVAKRKPLTSTAPEPEKKRRSKKGEATLWIEVVSQDSGAALADVDLAISKAGVGNYSGEGVSALEGALRKFPKTGEDGRARFRLRPGAYTLHVSWGERHQGRKNVDVAELADKEERTQRIELPTADDLRFLGRVLDEGTGAPIAGAEVLLFEGDSWGNNSIYQQSNVLAELAHTTTDAEGRFELASASWKHSMVRVRARGFATGYTGVEPEHTTRDSEVVMKVGPSATLVGLVERAGQPMAGIHVSLSISKCWIRGVETGSDGRCSFEDVPAGMELEVRISRPEPEAPAKHNQSFGGPSFPYQRLYQEIPEPLMLTPGETREPTWQLGVLCTLKGTVRDAAGRALPHLRLCLIRDSELRATCAIDPVEPLYIGSIMQQYPDVVSTDERGAFLIPDLPSGTWWIGPWGSGGEIAPFAKRVTIQEGATELDVDIEVHSGLFIDGIVVAPDGTPVEKAQVTSAELGCTTDDQGGFRLGPLVPGNYPMTARTPGFAESALVSASAGEGDVRLQLQLGGTLRLRIVDAWGAPLPDAHVWLFRKGENDSVRGARKKENDLLICLDLAPARYSLVGLADDRIGWNPGIEVLAGSDVTQTLVVAELAARLRVRSEDKSFPYAALTVLRDGAPVALAGLTRGKDRTLSVPAGPCEVWLASMNGEWKQTLSATALAGQETEVVFPRR